MRKLKEKWVNDSNTLAELRIRVGVLENEKNAFGVQNSENSELEKSKKNNEAFVGSDNVQTNEPPSKRSKNAQEVLEEEELDPDRPDLPRFARVREMTVGMIEGGEIQERPCLTLARIS
ncbi:hypothetical protein P8452_45091 [Trifolium repens]|nr:hypothetical protein QL285_030223 [Trifolium repens]WJX59814.1 hypothetical protein P8452_45091 [Trifolium repens]